MKKRDTRHIAANSAQGLKSPFSKRPCCSAIIQDGALTAFCGAGLFDACHPKSRLSAKALLFRYKARHFLLRLQPQVRIQRLTNNVRIVQVVLKAEFGQSALQVGRRSERDIRVLYLSHDYFLFCCSPFSLFISRYLWLSDAVRALLAWGSESLIPAPGKETSQIFPRFVKLALPFQVLSQRMLRAISHQNREPKRDSRHVQAYSPRAFIDDLPFVLLQFLYVSRQDCLLLVSTVF